MTDSNGTNKSENTQASGVKNTLASAYGKATSAYDHLMSPIRQINDYVDKKNELDREYAEMSQEGAMTEEEYNTRVSDLQTACFGEDTNRLAVADKFEAIADWKEAHGIDKIEDSVGGMVTSIKEAFAQTTLGRKFAEIKQMAADMGDTHEDTQQADGPEDSEEKTSTTVERTPEEQEAWLNGEDLPSQLPSSDRAVVLQERRKVYEQQTSDRYSQAVTDLGVEDMDAGDNISASVEMNN